MKPFDYHRPETLQAALELLTDPGATAYGGGTNLLDMMKCGAALPGTLVDVTALPGLQGVSRAADGRLRLGAALRNSDLARDPLILAEAPLLSEAVLSGASGQIRNMATTAGNLLQAPRCPHYALPESPCARRDDRTGCAARDHAGRDHAVLGWDDSCRAVHPSDLCVGLAALGATVEIATLAGRSEQPLAALHPLPSAGRALEPGALITAVLIPAASLGLRARYVKVRERTSFAFALVSAAAGLEIADGRITRAGLALGGVAATPWRRAEAEAALIGAAPGPETFARAAALLLQGASPSGENGFKIALAERVAIRALSEAVTPRAGQAAWPGSVFDAPKEDTPDVA
ncbi:FAD binding domain-containing protein [Maritimibacter alkaliphilus]|uniref:FAD binding domain-containing protein n=1 Tax=Maritimibacter alkaliphilus TaxID=404236 RepID=UPI001C958155|nr:xanthine dehydrogenase family protein subunit M [Maritimibacter alkaliphilus]MBY6089857.1 xanthine dehydrogenase family protein subunit M [Maritimibacter alkaliphilus]